MSSSSATTKKSDGIEAPSVSHLLNLPFGIQGGEEFKVVAQSDKNKVSCVHFHLGTKGGGVASPKKSDISIVFSHATGFHKELWYPVIEDLAEALYLLRKTESSTEQNAIAHTPMDLLAIDAPGHGDSDPRPGYSWRRIMKDTLDVLDATGFSHDHQHSSKIRIGVGHSMGGAVLASAEALRPNTFTHLILIEPMILPPETWSIGNPLAIGALKRRTWVEDIETARKGYQGKRIFKGWDDRAFKAYLKYGYFDAVVQDEGKIKHVKMLKCLPYQEGSTFVNGSDLFEPFTHSSGVLASEEEHRERQSATPSGV